MKLTERQEKLLQFVKECHGDQVRKYTGEPYWNHMVRVASLVSHLDPEEMSIEVALCHDLFEDTECTLITLREFMVTIGYDMLESRLTCHGVKDLTDQYTAEAYPKDNRAERKAKECKRLSRITYTSQSVKYADMIDNSESITVSDKAFAKVYLSEKKEILRIMRNGDFDLYIQCCAIVANNIYK